VLPDAYETKKAEDFAVEPYSAATVVGGYPGTYPPDGAGSSGLTVWQGARVARHVPRLPVGAHAIRAVAPFTLA
jgi:hypothetical protein